MIFFYGFPFFYKNQICELKFKTKLYTYSMLWNVPWVTAVLTNWNQHKVDSSNYMQSIRNYNKWRNEWVIYIILTNVVTRVYE